MITAVSSMRLIEPDTGAFRFAPVDRARLIRYLGVPSEAELDDVTRAEIDRLDAGRSEVLSFWQRAVALPIDRLDGRWIELEGGVRLESTAHYVRGLREHGADWLVVAAFTVGAAAEDLAGEHLKREELFEAYVFKQWTATMTEQTRAWLTHALCAWADQHGRSLLPYSGPGYNGWPLREMTRLLQLLGCASGAGPVRVLESGMLVPVNSMLIVYGATPRRDAHDAGEALAQCHRCAMRNCRYRVGQFDTAAAPEIVGVAI